MRKAFWTSAVAFVAFVGATYGTSHYALRHPKSMVGQLLGISNYLVSKTPAIYTGACMVAGMSNLASEDDVPCGFGCGLGADVLPDGSAANPIIIEEIQTQEELDSKVPNLNKTENIEVSWFYDYFYGEDQFTGLKPVCPTLNPWKRWLTSKSWGSTSNRPVPLVMPYLHYQPTTKAIASVDDIRWFCDWEGFGDLDASLSYYHRHESVFRTKEQVDAPPAVMPYINDMRVGSGSISEDVSQERVILGDWLRGDGSGQILFGPDMSKVKIHSPKDTTKISGTETPDPNEHACPIFFTDAELREIRAEWSRFWNDKPDEALIPAESKEIPATEPPHPSLTPPVGRQPSSSFHPSQWLPKTPSKSDQKYEPKSKGAEDIQALFRQRSKIDTMEYRATDASPVESRGKTPY